MSRQEKRKKPRSNKPHKEHTTFDPKLHHKSHGSSGYGMKRNHVATDEENSGSQLAHIFDTK